MSVERWREKMICRNLPGINRVKKGMKILQWEIFSKKTKNNYEIKETMKNKNK